MEKFVNDYITNLDGKLDKKSIIIAKTVLYEVLQKYDVTVKETSIIPYTDFIPEEMKQYLVLKKIEGLSDKSLHQYERALRKFFSAVHKQVADITTNDCRLFLYMLQKETNMSNLSLNNQRTYLNIFFQWCVDNEYINRNPCIKIPPFKFEKKEREPLTDVEMESLRSVCVDYRDRAIVETLYSTACRVDELVNIELNDIDFCARTVKVLGKGNKHRTVYLNARATVALTEYLEHREFNSPYVFISSKAPFNNLTTRTIENIVNRLGIKAGISGRVFPHRI